ncbi:UNVERIFIED_CONTAM: hypothetical protein FKN15_022852 [Acipenser sinensis]
MMPSEATLAQSHLTSFLARDSGLPALSSTATVLCTVLDHNDNTPDFILRTFEIKIPENQDPGIIYTALGSDEDARENGIIEYKLVEAFTGMQLNSLTISLTISFVVFLLLAISLVGLVLRFRGKDVKVKTRTVDSIATGLNQSISDTFENNNGHGQSPIILQDLAKYMDIRDKKEVTNPCRHSDSSGRDSANGATAEDEASKMINEHHAGKVPGLS